MRPRGSLLSQLLIAFSVFAVLIAIAAGIGAIALGRQQAASRELTGRYQVLQESDGKMGEAFTVAQYAVLHYALTAEPGFLAPLGPARGQYRRRLAILRQRTPAALRRYVTIQSRAGAAWFALAPAIMAVPADTAGARALVGKSSALTRVFFAANVRMQELLHNQIERVSAGGTSSLRTGLAWSAAALAVAVLLVLALSLSTLRTVTRPLRGLTATVRRLTSGDYAARAAVTGSREVREVAQAVNRQADESDRLRAQESESNRLRAMARAAGIRIREHLTAADILREAQAVLAENVDADGVRLHLVADGRMSSPAGQEHDPGLAQAPGCALTAADIRRLADLFRRQASELVQDVRGPDAGQVPPRVIAAMLEAGIASCLITPFGAGEEMLGFIAAERRGPGRRPWRAAEVDAVESIAADLGRGLHHARLYEAENRLVADLKALDQAKSDFFATVSHELRAPLTSIEGYVEMLRDGEAGPVTAEQNGMLRAVERSAVRLRSLIEDVFMLAKLESGAFETAMGPVDLAGVVGGAVEALRPSVTAKGLSFQVDLPADGLIVSGDAGQLDRAMMNLLSNAVKFTPEQGHVQVTASAEGPAAVVRIQDSGIGIPEQEQRDLFSRFYRASNARSRGIPGTGLGLPIVRTIVTGHGGEIRLESQQDVGTVATITLPLPAAPPPAGSPAQV